MTKDFLRFGSPMQLLLWILSVLYLSVFKFWYISWTVTGACLVVVIFARIGTSSLRALIFGKKKSTPIESTTTKAESAAAEG